MKKILIVSRSFYPMNSPRSFRTTELAKEFARQGHEVIVLTPKNGIYHEPFEKEYGVKIKDLGKLRFKQMDTSSGIRLFSTAKRYLNRILNLLFEFPDIELIWRVKHALERESGYDLLISIAVPHPVHWGVASAWEKNGRIAKVWVADCGDPYMGATMDTFGKVFYFAYFEKKFCKITDYLSVPIESAKNAYYPEFRNKIKVIPQGFNFEEVKIDHSLYSKNRIPTFAYAGDLLGGGRDPFKLLDYLTELQNDYKFIVYTRQKHILAPYLHKAGPRIEHRNYIARNELLKVLSKMDFLVNLQNRSTTQMPSKLIDYYLTGRPVLSLESSRLDKKKINKFLNFNFDNRYQYDNVDQYRIENVCNKFLNLCEKSHEYAA